MLHNFIATAADPTDDVTLFLGGDRNGALVEIGVLDTDDGPVIMARTITDKQRAAEQIAERLANRDPADTDWRDGAPLRRIADTFAASVDAEAGLETAIGLARTQGHSWAAIAAVLGVSKQSAQRRYTHLPVPRIRDTA